MLDQPSQAFPSFMRRGCALGATILFVSLMGCWRLWTWQHQPSTSANMAFFFFLVMVTLLFGTVLAVGALLHWMSQQSLPWQTITGEVVRLELAEASDKHHIYFRVDQSQWPSEAKLAWSEDAPPSLVLVVRNVSLLKQTRSMVKVGQRMTIERAITRWFGEPLIRAKFGPQTDGSLGRVVERYQWNQCDESAPSRQRTHPSAPEPLIEPAPSPTNGLVAGGVLAIGLAAVAIGGMVWAWQSLPHRSPSSADYLLVGLIGMGLPLLPLILSWWGLYVLLDRYALTWQPAQITVLRNSFTPEYHGGRAIVGPYANMTLRLAANQTPLGVAANQETETQPPAFIFVGRELKVSHVFRQGLLSHPRFEVGSHFPVAVAVTRWSHQPLVRLPCAYYGNSMPADDVPLRKRVVVKPLSAGEWVTIQKKTAR